VGTRHALGALAARDVTVSGPTLQADASLEEASHVFGTTFQPEFPVMSGTDVVGVLGFKDLLTGLKKHGASAPVREAMRNAFNGVDAQMPLEDVLAQMKENSDPLVLVTRDERYVGVLPRENLDELIAIHRALQKHWDPTS
jgi:predicted transcriptional regulator